MRALLPLFSLLVLFGCNNADLVKRNSSEIDTLQRKDTTPEISNISDYIPYIIYNNYEGGGFGGFSTKDQDEKQLSGLDAGPLVDSIHANPGFYTQVCSTISPIDPKLEPTSPPDTIFYPYAIPGGYVLISANRFMYLRKKRTEVINYILAKPNLDDHYLEMLLDLNAVEALPTLLRFEKKLHDLTFSILSNWKLKGKISVYGTIPSSYAKVLSVISGILRQERYNPLLDSQMEKEYAILLKKEALEYYPNIKTKKDIPANELDYLMFDPIYNVPYRAQIVSFHPIDTATSSLIVKWATDYLSNTSEIEKKRAPSRMNPWPVLR